MASYLEIPLKGGGSLLQVHALEHGVLSELALDAVDGLLHIIFALQVIFKSHLEEVQLLLLCLFLDVIAVYIDSPDGQVLIHDPVVEFGDLFYHNLARVGGKIHGNCTVSGLRLHLVGVAHLKGHGLGDQILFDHFKGEKLHHLLHDEPSLLKAVIPHEHLAPGEGVALRLVSLDVLNGGGFQPPGVVYEELRIDAEDLVHEILVSFGYVSHGIDAVFGKPFGGASSHPPEVRDGLMIPEGLPVAYLVELADEIRRMLGRNIQGHLGQIQIGAYAAGGPHANLGRDLSHEKYRHLSGCLVIQLKVVRHIQKTLIYGIHVDVVL